MKSSTIIFLIFLFNSMFVCSQSIKDVFLLIPDSALKVISKSDRNEMLKYDFSKVDIMDVNDSAAKYHLSASFELIDTKKSYLRIVGDFEGHIQIRMWDWKRKEKLLGVYYESCGPLCAYEYFLFYTFNGNELINISSDSVLPNVYPLFFNGPMDSLYSAMDQNGAIATQLFDLSQDGNVLMALWGNESGQEFYKNYGLGDRMKLTLGKTGFVLSKPYWAKEVY